MRTIVLTVSKNRDGLYEAYNGNYNFYSRVGESMDDFQIRLTKYFIEQNLSLWFGYEK